MVPTPPPSNLGPAREPRRSSMFELRLPPCHRMTCSWIRGRPLSAIQPGIFKYALKRGWVLHLFFDRQQTQELRREATPETGLWLRRDDLLYTGRL